MSKNWKINGILKTQHNDRHQHGTAEEIIDYSTGILRSFIQAFRTHYVDGAELYKILQKQQSLEITDLADQEKLFDAKMEEFEKATEETQKSFDKINTVKAAMRVIVDNGGDTEDENVIKRTLEPILKKLDGLKEVHAQLVNKFLTIESQDLNKMPTKIKTYQEFNKFMDMLKEKMKMNKNLLDFDGVKNPIKTETLSQIFKILSTRNKTSSSLILPDLGNIFNINLMKHLHRKDVYS